MTTTFSKYTFYLYLLIHVLNRMHIIVYIILFSSSKHKSCTKEASLWQTSSTEQRQQYRHLNLSLRQHKLVLHAWCIITFAGVFLYAMPRINVILTYAMYRGFAIHCIKINVTVFIRQGMSTWTGTKCRRMSIETSGVTIMGWTRIKLLVFQFYEDRIS